ncbi:helix-turn-helix domain-containing protein [Janibacter hoylei]|uniref:helix-turn-helix domain-containing protein n=1 Tax=Janibacter hoylei TaxID=364298 RepID=UPI0036AF4DED
MGSRLDDLFAPYADQTHLSVADLAVLFGVTKETVRRWLTMGVIPAYKVGASWVILTAEVRDWMEQQRNQDS